MLYQIPVPGGGFLATPASLGLNAAQTEALAKNTDPHLRDMVEEIANDQLRRLATMKPAGTTS